MILSSSARETTCCSSDLGGWKAQLRRHGRLRQSQQVYHHRRCHSSLPSSQAYRAFVSASHFVWIVLPSCVERRVISLTLVYGK